MIRFNGSTQDQSGKLLLAGDIVTMNGERTVHRRGRVCIDGATIAAVLGPGDPLPAAFAQVEEIDTGGTIYPGLIDLHNHLTYNMLPLWNVPRKFTNRNQWRTEEPSYQTDVALPASVLARHPDPDYTRAIIRFAECRSLFGGVTTGQGMSMSSGGGARKLFQGLVRNVEQPIEEGWAAAGGQTLDYQPDEIESKLVPALAQRIPFFYHLSEGTDREARQRFRDLRRPDRSWALGKGLICVHCVGLWKNDFDVLEQAAGMVWSPTSNLLLYGKTANVAAAKANGIPIALGVDWSPSGCKNLLGELKMAHIVSEKQGGVFSPAELVAMATAVPAAMLGWQRHVGTIARGRRADLLVLQGQHADPYMALIDARETSIRAILIDGRVRLGEAAALCTADDGSAETFAIGGKNYYIDLLEGSDDPMAGMSLRAAVDKLADGLDRLPALRDAKPSGGGAQRKRMPAPEWRLDLDMEMEEPAPQNRMMTMAAPAPLRSMKLEPLTAVDDPQFPERLLANPNLPAYVRKRLRQ